MNLFTALALIWAALIIGWFLGHLRNNAQYAQLLTNMDLVRGKLKAVSEKLKEETGYRVFTDHEIDTLTKELDAYKIGESTPPTESGEKHAANS